MRKNMEKYILGTNAAAILGLLQSGKVRNPKEIAATSYSPELRAAFEAAGGTLACKLVSATLLDEQARQATSNAGTKYANGEYNVKFNVTFEAPTKDGVKTFTQKMHACDALTWQAAGKDEITIGATYGSIDRPAGDTRPPIEFLVFKAANRLTEAETLLQMQKLVALQPV